MEVTEPSPHQLKIVGGFPPWWGLFVLGPLFIGLVFLALWQPTSLTCERGGDCTLEISGLLGDETQRFPAASLVQADVARASGRSSATYRVELALTTGMKPLSEVYSSGRPEMEREAKRINEFVAGAGGPRLVVARDDGWALLAGLGMVALALLLTYFVPRRYHTVIDEERREVRHRKTWLGLGGERRVALDDVTDVALRPYRVPINGQRWLCATLETGGRPLVLGYGPDRDELDDYLAQVRAAI